MKFISCRVSHFVLILGAVSLLLGPMGSNTISMGAEKVRLAPSVGRSIIYNLPYLAASKMGLWKQSGLEVEWVGFQGGSLMYKAVVAGDIKIGMTWATSEIQARAAGIPTMLIADMHPDHSRLFVLAKSAIKKPQDLKGQRIGVLRFGTGAHALGRMVIEALGLTKSARFVSTGGVRENIAALKAGSVDAVVQAFEIVAGLQARGQVRQVADVDDYRPKNWHGYVMYARQDFIKARPKLVGKIVSAIVKGGQDTMRNSPWAVGIMTSRFNQTKEAAKLIFDNFEFSKDGRLNREAMANISNFMIKYGIVSREKVPPVEDLFTQQFTP